MSCCMFHSVLNLSILEIQTWDTRVISSETIVILVFTELGKTDRKRFLGSGRPAARSNCQLCVHRKGQEPCAFMKTYV